MKRFGWWIFNNSMNARVLAQRITTFGITLGLAIFISACSTAPATGERNNAPEAMPNSSAKPKTLVKKGFQAYSKRDYKTALEKFQQAANGNGAKTRSQALIGEMLIYLSSDKEWRNLDNARAALGKLQTASGENGKSSLEAQLLLSALNSLMVAETDNAEMQKKLGVSYEQISKLKNEQEKLNAALEKLRSLTLQ